MEEIFRSLWALDRELEAVRYVDLSNDILQTAYGLFDEEKHNLPPDAFERYLRITRAQPGIRLTLDERELTVERTLWVQSLSEPSRRITARELPPYVFSPAGEAERNHLILLNILYEEFEAKATGLGLAHPSQTAIISLPQFRSFLSLLSDSVKKLGRQQ